MAGFVPIRTRQVDSGIDCTDNHVNCFMRFIPLRHRFFQLMLLILSLYIVHAHYSELDAIYASIPRYMLQFPAKPEHTSHQAHYSERALYISSKITASVERTDGGVV